MAGQPGGRESAPQPLVLVQDFVNTNSIEDELDLLSTPEQMRQWLLERRLLKRNERVDEGDRARLLAAREALRSLLVANAGGGVDEAAFGVLDRAADAARFTVRFSSAGEPTLLPAAGGVDGAVGRILAVVVDAARAGTWPRLKACQEHSCRWAFYDRSRNASGTWCSMSICGARSKMRAYRARHRERR